MDDPQIYTDEQLISDMAKAIAQGFSGVVGTVPAPENVALAMAFAEILNDDSLTEEALADAGCHFAQTRLLNNRWLAIGSVSLRQSATGQ